MVEPRTFLSPPARKSAGIRRIVCQLIGILTLFALTFSARAIPQFDVFLGYDGVVPEASWFPIVCEIKNDGPGFVGVIEVTANNYNNQDHTRRLIVELPTGTLKRVVIPVFSAARYQSSWDVHLLDQRRRDLAPPQTGIRPRKQITSATTLLGAIPRTASGVPVLRAIVGNNQTELQPTTARLQTSILPDNPLVFEGMDSLYLNSEKVSELTSNQKGALSAWLNAGGHLIIGVEQIGDVNGSPWLQELMPCELKDVRNVQNHAELQAWLKTGVSQFLKSSGRNKRPEQEVLVNPFADLPGDPAFEAAPLQIITGKPRNAEILVSVEDTPAIVTAHRGYGRVTALLFSPEREPMRSWKNLPTFWSKVTEVSPKLYASENSVQPRGGYSTDGIFGAMIDSKQVRKLPVGWLLLLLIVYLLVIGPFDQMWLKRVKRPMLTWITFPCYVVLFSLLIYFIGYRLRAGETEWNELHVVDVLEHNGQAELRGRTYASIYSPVNATYKVESAQNCSTFRGEFVSSWNGGGGNSSEKADVVQNGDNYRAEIFVPVWTSQLYVSDWWMNTTMPLRLAVVPDNNGWQVTVENLSDHDLKNAHLVVSGRVLDLKEIPKGQKKTFGFKKEEGTGLRDFVYQHGGNFQSAIMHRHQAFGSSGSGQIQDLPNSTMAVSFVSQLANGQTQQDFVSTPGLDLSSVVEHGNAVLLAWESDFSPVRPINQFPTRRSHKDTLWRISVPVYTQPSL
ncbi:MAG: hypothetical protein JWQ71_4744 [Pedosphaera sp.]|nr:hypothetical protein [Pedosphaera sp.]